MPANKNDVSTIGNQIGRLLQQYELRITYANWRAKLMDEERLKASALYQKKRALDASIAKEAWSIYAKNLTDKKAELVEAVKRGLIGYGSNERVIWWRYFIERESAERIAEDVNMSLRSVQRLVASMKANMELRFSTIAPKFSEGESPKWSHVELAGFLQESPSEDYVKAIKDIIEGGYVSIDLLESDPRFQEYLGKLQEVK